MSYFVNLNIQMTKKYIFLKIKIYYVATNIVKKKGENYEIKIKKENKKQSKTVGKGR